MKLSNIKAIKSSYQMNYSDGKTKWVGDKEKKKSKKNELRKKVMHVLTLLFFISNVRENGLNMDFNSLKKQNLLQKLKFNKDIVIKHPDKGNGLVILNRDEYLKTMTELISDQQKFRKLKKMLL